MAIVPWFFGFVVLMIGIGMIGSESAQQSDDPRSDGLVLVVFSNGSSRISRPTGSRSGSAFSGTVWAYVGWGILAVISVITIVGWAWVYVAWMRWICRNIQGTRREVLFIGSGLEFLWRAIVAAIASIFIIPIPWVYRWMSQWLASQTVLAERGASANG